MLTSATPVVHIPQPPGPKAPTTAAAVLDELLKLLPPGPRAPEIITKIPGNCVEALTIDVDHGGGTAVQIDVPACLAWNGQANPPTQMAITAAQAEQIAANPWPHREAAHQQRVT
jgi:hypothetical protein